MIDCGLLLRLEERRTHHGRRGEREHERHQDCRRERDREFSKEAPQHSTHEQNGEEDGDEGHAHRENGEGDLSRSLQCCLLRRHSQLELASGVLENHDGIVDHEPGRDGERHERKVVEAEAAEVHDPKSRRSATPELRGLE